MTRSAEDLFELAPEPDEALLLLSSSFLATVFFGAMVCRHFSQWGKRQNPPQGVESTPLASLHAHTYLVFSLVRCRRIATGECEMARGVCPSARSRSAISRSPRTGASPRGIVVTAGEHVRNDSRQRTRNLSRRTRTAFALILTWQTANASRPLSDDSMARRGRKLRCYTGRATDNST